MLKQETISKIALCTAIAGIALLFLLSESIGAKQVKIKSIDESMLGSVVKVNAVVESAYKKENVLFLQLYDGTGKIKAVLFRPKPGQEMILQKGRFASIEGKVQLYKEELEIIVENAAEWG